MPGVERVVVGYVGRGIKTDYERLMSRYALEKSVRYEVFASVWKELRMTEIFCLRQNDREVREFTEELMKHALRYTMSTYDLQTRVCALYILFAVFHKQPIQPPVKIRVTSEQWQHLLLLLHEAREQRHLDVEYVFTSLQVDAAFTLVATTTYFIPELEQKGENNDQKPTEHEFQESSIISAILQPENIDQLSAIHEQYDVMKSMLAGPASARPHESLNIIKPNLVQQLTKLVTAHQEKRKFLAGKGQKRVRRDSGQTTTSESEPESDSESALSPKRSRHHSEKSQSHGTKRAAIKARAFSNAPGTRHKRRRHIKNIDISFSSPERETLMEPPPVLEQEAGMMTPLYEITELPKLTDILSMPMLTSPTSSERKGKMNSHNKGKGKRSKNLQTVQTKPKRASAKSKKALNASSTTPPKIKTEDSPADVDTKSPESSPKKNETIGKMTKKKTKRSRTKSATSSVMTSPVGDSSMLSEVSDIATPERTDKDDSNANTEQLNSDEIRLPQADITTQGSKPKRKRRKKTKKESTFEEKIDNADCVVSSVDSIKSPSVEEISLEDIAEESTNETPDHNQTAVEKLAEKSNRKRSRKARSPKKTPRKLLQSGDGDNMDRAIKLEKSKSAVRNSKELFDKDLKNDSDITNKGNSVTKSRKRAAPNIKQEQNDSENDRVSDLEKTDEGKVNVILNSHRKSANATSKLKAKSKRKKGTNVD